MSTSALLDIKIIPKEKFDLVQVLNELKIFVEKAQRYSHYNFELRNNEFGKFHIFYDRVNHFEIDGFLTAIDGLHSFDAELSFIALDGCFDINVFMISTGSKIRDISPDRSEPEDESVDLDTLRE